jgi:hypothetical protein
MDDDIKNSHASTAVLNTKTARPKLPEDGTERLKAYRWAKGQSGNPGGRSRKLPMSDTLRLVLAMPLPDVFRATLEGVIKQTLPKKMTFMEGLAFGEACAPFAPELKNFKVEFLREMREATEGSVARRTAIPGDQLEKATEETVDISDRIMLGLVKVIKRRQELYNLDLPRFDAMQREVAEEVRKEDAAIGESRGKRGN